MSCWGCCWNWTAETSNCLTIAIQHLEQLCDVIGTEMLDWECWELWSRVTPLATVSPSHFFPQQHRQISPPLQPCLHHFHFSSFQFYFQCWRWCSSAPRWAWSAPHPASSPCHRVATKILQRFWEGSIIDLFLRGRAAWNWIHDFVTTFGANDRPSYMA